MILTPIYKSKVWITAALALMGAVLMLVFAGSASAHGYIESPGSRSALCAQGINKNCGSIQYEPQSVEGVGNFPTAGVPDGNLAGVGKYPELEEQSADRWTKITMNGGKNTFQWKLTALHATKEWKYYITKKGWDQSKPLTRAQLDLTPFCYINDKGARPNATVTHECNVPTDRSGYNIILAVWEIADTGNAFYQVVDVNLVNGSTPPATAPAAPTGLASSAQTTNSITLNWLPSTSTSGVKQYEISRNGAVVGTSTTTSYTDTALTANKAYTYSVVAIDTTGARSVASSSVSVSTKANVTDTAAPTVPAGIMSHSQTQTSIDLMWSPSTDNVGVTKYEVYRNGTLVGTSTTTTYVDSGLKAGVSYSYTITALDAAGNRSAASSAFAVSTLSGSVTDTQAPTIPVGVNSSAQTDSTITLTWTASTDNVGVAQYTIYRTGVKVGTSSIPSYTDAGLTASTAYSYTVAASDAAGNVSPVSTALSVSTKAKSAIPTWDKNSTYLAGDHVLYNGVEYIAQWWTKGDQPDTTSSWKPATSGTIQAWSADKAYEGQSVVTYGGKSYKAQWWTKGDVPGTASVWLLVS
ncbi:chitin-binding protein [Paenibacillus shirakamiensis]|uniref:Chitin-binding protein n=1 Tax=Paenibacillus shirakamiensis TaxID=1265935 RepID=A0ABS4JIF6_9BACL|nr:lytic polysaccharide monooxygenase [Paenibacillus shirakamiensis]MBP2001501.1 chitin-binding protein [Paenibacillus shirakamiensis]